jgi:hypothetical protein
VTVLTSGIDGDDAGGETPLPARLALDNPRIGLWRSADVGPAAVDAAGP